MDTLYYTYSNVKGDKDMNLKRNLLFLIGGMMLLNVPAFAQAKNVGLVSRKVLNVREMATARQWNAHLREVSPSFFVPNLEFGRACSVSSFALVGGKGYAKKVELGKLLLPKMPTAVSNVVLKRHLLERAFPGYITNFEHVWDEGYLAKGLSVNGWGILLEGRYPQGTQFAGAFVPDLRAVLALSSQPITQWTTSLMAMRQAYSAGCRLKSGFFVIAVKKPRESEHDVLVLNLEAQQFISLNESRALIEEEPAIWSNRDKAEPAPINEVKINPHENTLKDAVEFRNNYEHVEETASPKAPVKQPSHF